MGGEGERSGGRGHQGAACPEGRRQIHRDCGWRELGILVSQRSDTDSLCHFLRNPEMNPIADDDQIDAVQIEWKEAAGHSGPQVVSCPSELRVILDFLSM